MNKLTAINDNVLIRLDARPEATLGGIIIPEIGKKVQQLGTVVSAGGKCRELTEGDHVVIGEHAGTLFTTGGEDYVVVNEGRVMAVVS